MTSVSVGIMGKHPGFGDFLRHGISDPVAEGLSKWLDGSLHRLRTELGDNWHDFWDRSITLRFWIGRSLSGATLAGILVPSRDKVGRRFPFILLAEGIDQRAPVADPDQGLYDAFEAHHASMQPGTTGAASLLDGFDPVALGIKPESEDQRAEGPLIWAHHPDGDLDALLRAAGPVDATRGATTRSYWWAPARTEAAPAIWLGQAGLPDAAGLGWLLSGGAYHTPMPRQEDQPHA
ncbi:type VI secretion system-associated protein TagF [Loktanella sp. IMCC34160]|uniref:type VI secretion system-associated protein TagF n=1 Tax=Loktanella sp. IMCC34160 TaxID=2510646 RepID=UPI00101C113E|nr:type VI secretion system-associated protein TagF [Loktanella sp. IMCC34160]RYG91416.1 type VI secretion system-associated protein TagF [Loktanella sp. IMCC34160]